MARMKGRGRRRILEALEGLPLIALVRIWASNRTSRAVSSLANGMQQLRCFVLVGVLGIAGGVSFFGEVDTDGCREATMVEGIPVDVLEPRMPHHFLCPTEAEAAGVVRHEKP